MTSNVLPFPLEVSLKGVIPVDREQEEQEKSKSRSVELPVGLWSKIEKDAKRCRRSVTKQIEAILALYYGVESSVNVDEHALTSMANAADDKSRLKKTA